jgi:uncharacterized membrane protein YjgN (DUF898 family)
MSPRRQPVRIYPTLGRHEYVVAVVTAVGLLAATLVTLGLLHPIAALPAALFVKAAARIDKLGDTP